jgi:hypothetical protein
MYYLGFDIRKDDSRVAVLDDDGEVVDEARVQNASLEKIAEEYAGSKAAIEATSNYYTIYDTLDEYLDMVDADPTQTKAIGYAEVKNDRLDAKLRQQLPRRRYDRNLVVPALFQPRVKVPEILVVPHRYVGRLDQRPLQRC